MNILMANKFYYPKGGAERYYFNLSKLLEKNGHKVIPFAMQSNRNLKTPYSKYFLSEISTRPSWNIFKDLKTVFRIWWSFEAQHKIKQLLKKEKIDIAHIHNIYHQISPSILPILKKQGIPVIMTIHDYHLISPNYNLYLDGKAYTKICGRKYWLCLKDKCVNKNFVQSLICVIEMYLHHKIYRKYIDVLIAPSNFVKGKLVQAGFSENKIKVVHHFIHLKNTETQKMQRHLNKEKYLLYFGRLSEEKGIGILIEAMKRLPKIKLKIAGRGPDEEKIKKLIYRYQLSNVEMLGYKNEQEIQNLIQNSSLVVVPSLTPETFGLSALEALALGKCVLASDIGALPELISKEFLIKPGNFDEMAKKIKQLISSQELTKNDKCVKMKDKQNKGKIGQSYAEKEHYKRIFNIYQDIKKT